MDNESKYNIFSSESWKAINLPLTNAEVEHTLT